MKTKVVFSLVCTFLISVLLVILLFLLTKKQRRPNGFLRRIQNHALNQIKSFDLHVNSYYIVGATRNVVYLGNTTAPGIIAVQNIETGKKVLFRMNNPYSFKIAWNYSRVLIDSFQFYLSDLYNSKLYVGDIKDFVIKQSITIPAQKISEIVSLNKDLHVIKFFDTILKQTVLGKLSGYRLDVDRSGHGIQKQRDGVFSMDGKLYYSHELKHLLYLYYYRNEFISMDTNLQVNFKGHTVDTIYSAQIQLDTLDQGRVISFSSSPLLVNQMAAVDSDQLYVVSNLMADNEQYQKFSNNTVIDCYHLKNGKYTTSFYLDNYKNQKLIGFYVYKGNLMALNGRYLVIYKLIV